MRRLSNQVPSNVVVIDRSCFSSPLGGFGNLGRNTFRGPMQKRFDLSFAKNTKINERMSIEVGFDLFNVFNCGQLCQSEQRSSGLGRFRRNNELDRRSAGRTVPCKVPVLESRKGAIRTGPNGPVFIAHWKETETLIRSLVHRCSLGFLRVVRRRLKAFDSFLGVVVVVAEALGPSISGDGAVTVAFGVVSVAHLDVRPNLQPRGLRSPLIVALKLSIARS